MNQNYTAMKTLRTSSKRNVLFFILWILSLTLVHGQIVVSNTNDSGAGSLRQAILDAEASTGADVIDLTGITGTITLASGLPNITEDLTINGAGNTVTIIDGANQFRPFFIGGAGVNDTDTPVVVLNNLAIQNGLVKGVDPTGAAGGGAGMGGAMFINDGAVTLNNIVFDGNQATGGNGGNDQFGGGGIGGDGPFANTGGAEASLAIGYVGGNGAYGAGGGGGIYNFNFGGADGGKGGYGAGGGGGGGHQSAFGIGGQGGSFAGSGATAVDVATAGGGGGAGLGGAIFLRNGNIDLNNSAFSNNSTTGGLGGVVAGVPTGGNGQGKGGAIFNHSGFISLDAITYSNNSAANAGSSATDNADIYGANLVNDVTAPVLTFTPLDQATDIAISTTMTITSDKPLYLNGALVVDADLAGLITINEGSLAGPTVAFTATLSNNVITIIPDADLNLQETYIVSFSSVDDFFFNATGAQSFSFSTSNNNSPTFTVANITVNEDDPETTESNWATNFDDGDAAVVQNLTLDIISNDHPEYFDGAITFTQGGAITFTPAADYFGVATLEAKLTDDGPGNASATESFTITITGVDDDPTLTPDPVTLNEDDGTVVISNWSNFDPGFMENETIGSFEIYIQEGEDLLSAFPDGNIANAITDEFSITLKPNASGTVKFEAYLNEVDGDFGSGILTITINPVDDPLVINSTPVTTAAEGTLYKYAIEAVDIDNEINVSITKPDWLSVGSSFQKVEALNAQRFFGLDLAPNGDIIGTDYRDIFRVDQSGNKSIVYDANITSLDLAVDANGNIYYVSLDDRVYKHDVQGNVTVIAGNGSEGYSGDGGPATSAALKNPEFIDVDSQGNVYIADQSGPMVIRKIDLAGNITTVVGNGTFQGSGGLYSPAGTSATADPRAIKGIAIHPTTDELYFVEYTAGIVYKVNGGQLFPVSAIDHSPIGGGPNVDTRIADIGNAAADGLDISNVYIHNPYEIAFAADGSYIISTYYDKEIGKVSATGTFTNIAGGNYPASTGDGDAALGADFAARDVVVLNDGSVAFADDIGQRLRILPVLTTLEGTPGDADVGVHSVSISATGGTVTVNQDFDITVSDTNSPPSANVVENFTYDEDAGPITAAVISNTDDGDAGQQQVLSVTMGTVSNTALFSTQPTIDINTGDLSFETAENANGSSTVDFTLSDDGIGDNSTDYSITITINPINDAPEFVNSVQTAINDGEMFLFDQLTSDAEGDAVTVSDVTIPSWIGNVGVLGKVNTLISNAGSPQRLAKASDGTIFYSTDTKIFKININGTTTQIAGGGASAVGENVDANSVSIAVKDLEIDAQDNIYFTDATNHVIRKIDNSNIITTVAGVFGSVASSIETGDVSTTKLNGPSELELASNGDMYYMASGFSKYQKISGGTVSTVFSGIFPGNFLHIDENDKFWVALSKALREVDEIGNEISSNTLSMNNNIQGINIISMEEIYLIDFFVVYKYNFVNNELTTVSGSGGGYAGDGGSLSEGKYSFLKDVVKNDAGEIILTDNSNNRVRILENKTIYGGTPVDSDAGDYVFSLTADDGNGGLTVLNETITVTDIEHDPTGINLSSDNVDENQVAGTVVGTLSAEDVDQGDTHTFALISGAGDTNNGSFTISGNQLETSAPLDFEADATLDVRIRVTDQTGKFFEKTFQVDLINKVDPFVFTTNPPLTVDEDSPYSYFFQASNDDGNTPNYSYQNLPSWLSEVDRSTFSTEIFIGGGASGTANGNVDGTGTAAETARPSEGTFDAAGNLYFVTIDYHQVKKVTPAGVMTTFAGDGTNGSIDGPLLSASFGHPRSITYDQASDIIYVGNAGLIRKIENGMVSTLAGDVSTGNVDDTGTSARFNIVGDMVVDSNGDLYIVDENNTAIRKVTAAGVVTTVVSGSGTLGFPRCIAMDNDGFLLVGGFIKVVRINPATSEVTTISNLPSGHFIDGLAVDASGNIFAANTANRSLNVILPDGTLQILAENPDFISTAQVPFTSTDALEIAPDGSLFVFDNRKISKFNNYTYLSGTPTNADVGGHTMDIVASFAGAADILQTFTVTVENTNDPPSALSLGNNTIDEYLLSGNAVGTLTTTDEDPGDTFTYTFVAGTGDTDNGSFTIDGDKLVSAEIFNFHTKNSYSVRVKSTDSGGETVEQQFAITINDVTDTPPQFRSTPVTTATEGSVYNYVVDAVDLLGEVVNTTATTKPAWLSFGFIPPSVTTLFPNGASAFAIDNDNTYYALAGTNVFTATPTNQTGVPLLASNDLINAIEDIAISPSKDIFVIDDDKHIKKISGGVLSTLTTVTTDIKRIGYHPGGFIVFLEDDNGQKNLKKLTLGGVVTSILDNISYTTGFAISPSGDIIFTNGGGQHIAVYDENGNTGSSITMSHVNLNDYSGAAPSGEIEVYTLNEYKYDNIGNLYVYYIGIDDQANFIDMIAKVTITGNSYDVVQDGDGYDILRMEVDANNQLNFATLHNVAVPNTPEIKIFDEGGLTLTGTPATGDVGTNSVVIKASDAATDVLQSFDIEVDYINDIPIDVALSASSVDENQAAITLVGQFTSTDTDIVHGDAHTYALVAGTGDDDNASFTITNNQLSTTSTFDKETKDSYSILVESTDTKGGKFEKAFTITVNNVNEAPTHFTTSASSIAENLPVGSKVTDISIVDPDASNTHVLELPDQDDNAQFTVSNGELLTAASFDFETKSEYTITILVKDGPDENAADYHTIQQTVVINVNDANDAPTSTVLNGGTVNENDAIGIGAGIFSTDDQDNGDSFIYTLVSGTGADDNASFTINNDVLETAESYDFEAKSSYSIRVKTDDQNGGTIEEVFTVTIGDLDDVITTMTLSANTQNENTDLGTTIGTLESSYNNSVATVTFSLVAGFGDNSDFTISGNELKNNVAFDFETKSSYSIKIKADDGQFSTLEKEFTITVVDISEGASDIALSNQNINENSAVGTTIGVLSASDPEGTNGSVFSLVAGFGDNASFAIDGTNLNSAEVFNFENKALYSIKVEVNDNDNNSYQETYTINVGDANDSPTDINLSNTSLDENVANGTVLGSLTSTDEDAAASATYSLVSGFGNNELFTISGSDLVTAADINFESNAVLNIKIKVDDSNGGTYEEEFTVNVTDLNDAPTDITLSSSSLDENSAAGSTIGTVSSADEDANATATYTLVSGFGDNASFTLTGDQLSNAVVFDYETKTSYSIKIKADDGNGGVYEKELTISVNDLDDVLASLNLSTTAIDENSAIGFVVGELSASYQNSTATTTFSLVDGFGDNSSFEIVGSQLKTKVDINYESKSSYGLKLKADDGKGSTIEKEVTIAVNDVNETPTAMLLSANTIVENSIVGKDIGTFTVTDEDATGTYSYLLVSGFGDNSNFAIGGNAIEGNIVFDFETKSSYSIKVSVDDGSGSTYEQEFTISILDTNEAPSDITLSSSSMDENAVVGSAVILLSTDDQDADEIHTYSLVSGFGDNALFSISGTDLKNAQAFDFETKSSYSIKIQSADNAGLHVEKEFTITINDLNEAPTAISLSSNSIDENQPAGSTVGSLSVVDVDANDSHIFSLVSGFGDNTSFSVNGNNLISAEIFDAETKNSYSIKVEVTDGGNSSYTEELTINISNVNEAVTGIALSNTSTVENISIGSTIGELTISDVDATDAHTLELVAGFGDNASFSIDGTSLKNASVFDFETKSSYNIKVKATDAGGLIFEQEFFISIIDANDAPATIVLSNLSLDEKAPVGTLVGVLSSTDQDPNDTHTYSLVPDFGHNAAFEIVGNELKNIWVFNFAVHQSCPIKVKVTDAAGASFEQEFTIVINDIVELKDQTINFPFISNLTFGDTGKSLNITVGSGLPVTLTSSNTSVIQINSDNTISAVGAGSAEITATQPGNALYNAAPAVTRTAVVLKAFQSITGFTRVNNITLADGPFTITATSSTGLPLNYTLLEGSGTLSGNVYTPTIEGIAVIQISLPGNANYEPAASEKITIITTSPAKTDQTITSFTLPDEIYLSEGTLNLSAIASSGLAVTYSVESQTNIGQTFATVSGDVLTLLSAGTVVVAAHQAGNDQFNPVVERKSMTIKPVFFIRGTLLNGAGVPMAGVVQVYHKDSDDRFIVDAGTNGIFRFEDVKDGDYHIAGRGDGHYRTWLGETTSWFSSTILTVNDNTTGVDLKLIAKPGTNLLTGNGTVTGRVVNGGSSGGRIVFGSLLEGEAIEFVSVFLIRISDDVIMTEAITDANGDFEITGIPEGSYRLQIEVAGAEMDLGSSTIDVDAEGTPIELTALVGEGGIVLEQVVTSLDEVFTNSVTVYPNPFNNQFSLMLENEFLGNIDVSIFSTDGRVLYLNSFYKSQLTHEYNVENVNIPSGLIILQLVHEDAIATYRLIKD